MRRLVEAEDAQRGKIQSVKDGRAGGEVVHAFGEDEITSMEHGAPEPAAHAEIAEETVVWHKWVVSRQLAPEPLETRVVGIAIEDGEEDGEGLLHAKEPFERPFPVELFSCVTVGDARGGYSALAGIVAFRGASPEEETEVEREGGGRGRAVLRATFLGERVSEV